MLSTTNTSCCGYLDRVPAANTVPPDFTAAEPAGVQASVHVVHCTTVVTEWVFIHRISGTMRVHYMHILGIHASRKHLGTSSYFELQVAGRTSTLVHSCCGMFGGGDGMREAAHKEALRFEVSEIIAQKLFS